MTTFIRITAAIAFSSIASAALAFPPVIDFPPGFPGMFGNKGSSSVVGEPFNPFAKDVDIRVACAEAGGELLREIRADGSIGLRCFVPRQ
ncbi:hypothetical protein [Devosia sp.]|uniref:hypothetical protein n=1 Tax=Devosia sp. TaxID=1871048 RepID=UPI0035B0C6AA